MDEKEKIKAYLQKHGMKPYKLAEKAGISFPIIYRWLKGERDIRYETLKKLQKAINE